MGKAWTAWWLAFMVGGVLTAPILMKADAPIVGAIRWDAWNGHGGGDLISSHVMRTLSPQQFHDRVPFYGMVVAPDNVSVDANQQAVMDMELQFAAAAGLRYFAYDTYCVWPADANLSQCAGYWGGPTPTSVDYKPSDPAYGLKLHLASEFAHLMNFTLLLLGASPATPMMRARYLPLLGHSSYQRVCGTPGCVNADRPLVFLFQASDNEAEMNGGWDAWRLQWEAFRNESLAQGSGNPYFVALDLTFDRAHTLQTNLGFDAVSAYALPTGTTLAGTPFSEQKQQAQSFWDAAKAAGVPVVPPVPTGWDPRPRAVHTFKLRMDDDKHSLANRHVPKFARRVNETAAHFIPATQGELTDMFQTAVQWIDSNPSAAPAAAALSYAWNENSEGGWILPTLGGGRDRLDAVAAALNP